MLWDLDMWVGMIAEFTLSLAVPADFIESCILLFIPPLPLTGPSGPPDEQESSITEEQRHPTDAVSPLQAEDNGEAEIHLLIKPSPAWRCSASLGNSASINTRSEYGGTAYTERNKSDGSFEKNGEAQTSSGASSRAIT